MKQTTEGNWCIHDPQHEWLKEIEATLSDLINSKLSSNSADSE